MTEEEAEAITIQTLQEGVYINYLTSSRPTGVLARAMAQYPADTGPPLPLPERRKLTIGKFYGGGDDKLDATGRNVSGHDEKETAVLEFPITEGVFQR